jgi:hypothetical protein
MSTKYAELRVLWRMVRTMALVVGVALSLFAVIELIRAYEVLRGVHAWVGYGFLALLGGSMAALGLYVGLTLARRPRVLTAPMGKVKCAGRRWLVRYCRYLAKYLTRLSENEHVSEADQVRAAAAAKRIAAVGAQADSAPAMRAAIAQVESETLEPILAGLDQTAEAKVRHAVRDIMIGVALSPYRSIDLMVVLYRSAAMIGAVTRVYNSRPHLRELLMTFRDTLRIVATVNYMNIGQKFIERLFSSVPVIGHLMDELTQAFGAGLMTSVAGHAAVARCRAFRGWDREEAAQSIAGRLGAFLKDVREMCTTDVLPLIRRRAKARGEHAADEPGFWEKIKSAVEHSAGEIADLAEAESPAVATPEGVVVSVPAAAASSEPAVDPDAPTAAEAGREILQSLGKVFRRKNHGSPKAAEAVPEPLAAPPPAASPPTSPPTGTPA